MQAYMDFLNQGEECAELSETDEVMVMGLLFAQTCAETCATGAALVHKVSECLDNAFLGPAHAHSALVLTRSTVYTCI